jgi:hypothetical protein
VSNVETLKVNITKIKAEIQELEQELNNVSYPKCVKKAIEFKKDFLIHNLRMAQKRLIKLERKLSKL